MKSSVSKLCALILCATIALGVFPATACGKRADLKVYNCYDYIDEDLIGEFETYYYEKTGEKIKVQYDCYDTPEDLYNMLKMKGADYDIVCPSDYMIEKMAREGMLQKIGYAEDSGYLANVSPFVMEKFKSVKWGNNGENDLSQYAMGYMWGTMGLCYDGTVDPDDMKTWTTLWDSEWAETHNFSVKKSVRDTYFIGLAKKYADELAANKSEDNYETFYNNLKTYFNDTTESTVNAMESILKALKENAYALEVDEGKDDLVNGHTCVYFAWSGDAVYAMDTADESDKELFYSVPEEGSNVWFDGWCIPTTAKNPELALEFAEFISKPENVIKNMEYIGYVSCVAGDEIFDWVTETYGVDEGEYAVNLNYFFKTDESADDYIVNTDVLGRQFSAQYPDETVVKRCVMMNYFPTDANDRVNRMWAKVLG